MNLLLLSDAGLISILCVAFAVVILVYIFIKKPFKVKIKLPKKQQKTQKQKNKQSSYSDLGLQKKDKYLYKKDLKFLYLLNAVLPNEYVVYPRVLLTDIVETPNPRNMPENIKGKTLDFVVFVEQTQKPLLVVDLYDNSFGDEELREQDKDVIEILKIVGMPIISILAKREYDPKELKDQILNILIPKETNENQ